MIKYETNSKLVKPGQTFVAIKGLTVDAHDFVPEALKNGAAEVVVQRTVEAPKLMLVSDTKAFLQDQLVREYSGEFKDIKFVGVTGTNGKTTTCFLTYQMLKQLGKNVAYIGTIGFFHNDYKQDLPNTTPDILGLYKLIMQAKENGAEYIVMEVSSHALELERIAGITYDVAGFTNFTQDHLDFHKSMEAYLNAKLKITNYLKDDAKIIVNAEDPVSQEFAKKADSLSVGENGDYEIKTHLSELGKTGIKFGFKGQDYKVETNLVGNFNVYNYLMSLALVNNLGFSIDEIIEKTDVMPPKGRLETVRVGEALAIVDYAHTPDAVSNAIDSCRELTEGRIITLIGCGGDRDPKKRPIMGNLATSKSDYVIFTNDNPRTEKQEAIMQDILEGNTSDNYEVIYDRASAIEKGLSMLQPNDILVILGKGHENYQIIGRDKIHFDDTEQVKLYLQKKASQQL